MVLVMGQALACAELYLSKTHGAVVAPAELKLRAS